MASYDIATPTLQLVLEKQRDDAELARLALHQAGECANPAAIERYLARLLRAQRQSRLRGLVGQQVELRHGS